MARPQTLTDDAPLSVTSAAARTRLQAGSERRAIINRIIDVSGTTRLRDLNAHFGFDCRTKVLALIRAGWLRVGGDES